MMVLPGRLALVLAIALGSVSLLYGKPDVDLMQHVAFEIDGSRASGYTLEARTVDVTAFRSERSIRDRRHYYSEPFYAPFRDFELYFRNHYVPSDQIERELDNDSDIFLSGGIVHSITLPADLRIGDSMAVSYTQRYSSLAFMPMINIPNVDRVREYRIEIEHPEEVSIDFDFFFPCGPIPYTVERPDRETTVLVVRDLEKRPDLAGFPFNNLQASVHIRVSDAAGTINAPSTSEFAGWYRGLFDHSATLSPVYGSLLSAEVAAAPTPFEKVRVIHDYVRRTIRYIADERGENAIIPRLPERVLQQGYGDCKDRAFLVAALARRHGITVYPVLLSTIPVPSFQGTHVWQFNHVICAFGDGASRIYFDPTARFCGLGALPSSDVGAQALVLTPSGAEKVRIPMPAGGGSTIDIEGSLQNVAACRFRASVTGDLLQGIRWALDDKAPERLPNRMARMLAGELQKISFDSVRIVSDADSVVVLEGSADLSRFVVGGGSGRRYLPRLAFSTENADLLERERDTFAIYLPARSELRLSLSLATAGAVVTSDSTAISGGGGRFTARAFSKGDRLRAEYSIIQREPYLGGAVRAPFLEYYRALLKSRSAVFTINPSGQ